MAGSQPMDHICFSQGMNGGPSRYASIVRNARVEVGPWLAVGPSTAQTVS